MDDFKTFTEIVSNLVTTIAAVVAGLWVLNRLKRERTDEAAIEMTLATESSLCPAQSAPTHYLVLFTVQLANKGKTKIEAKSERLLDGSVFNDGPEKLMHSCSLQIRALRPDATGPRALDWFEGGHWDDVLCGDKAVNVLIDYHNPKRRDAEGRELLEFWMEPGETYRMGVPVVLPPGVYVAKLTFVASEQERDGWDRFLEAIGVVAPQPPCADQNFWSQVFAFPVPTPAENSASGKRQPLSGAQ